MHPQSRLVSLVASVQEATNSVSHGSGKARLRLGGGPWWVTADGRVSRRGPPERPTEGDDKIGEEVTGEVWREG